MNFAEFTPREVINAIDFDAIFGLVAEWKVKYFLNKATGGHNLPCHVTRLTPSPAVPHGRWLGGGAQTPLKDRSRSPGGVGKG